MTNNGPNPATGVVLTDTVAYKLRYVSATATQGTVTLRTARPSTTSASVTYVNGIVTDTIGSIAAGASVTLTVTAEAIGDTYLGHSATATATSADPNPGNNTVLRRALRGAKRPSSCPRRSRRPARR